MKDLFGKQVGKFKTGQFWYPIWPISVWDCNYNDPFVMKLKKEIGDIGFARIGGHSAFPHERKHGGKSAWMKEKTGDKTRRIVPSIFNPAVAYWLLNIYAPKKGICIDPFAGGGTRAIMAAKHGLKYVGLELREIECKAIRKLAIKSEVEDRVSILCQDATICKNIKTNSADFLITCPPYWGLEKYCGGEKDLSMATSYKEFLKGIFKVIKESLRILKPGAVSCWVVGMLREDNDLICLNHDITRLHKKIGFKLKEEIVLSKKMNGVSVRFSTARKGNRYLIRTHEYALVFIAPG